MTAITIQADNRTKTQPWTTREKIIYRGFFLCYRLGKHENKDDAIVYLPGGRTVTWREIEHNAKAPQEWRTAA